MGDRKAVIKNADMTEEMQQEAIECATQALEKYDYEIYGNRNMYQVSLILTTNACMWVVGHATFLFLFPIWI